MKTKHVATFGMLIALAFILSYIETMIPVMVPVPGIKLGLANLVVLVALYSMGFREAFLLSMIRIVLVGFTFGSLSTMLFSFAGGILSLTLMAIFQKSKLFSMTGISIIGGLGHNIGQILVAMLVVQNLNLVYYLPILMISGLITGTVVGLVGALIVRSLRKYQPLKE
jgi:heptaprenyl diphosphate synthase